MRKEALFYIFANFFDVLQNEDSWICIVLLFLTTYLCESGFSSYISTRTSTQQQTNIEEVWKLGCSHSARQKRNLQKCKSRPFSSWIFLGKYMYFLKCSLFVLICNIFIIVSFKWIKINMWTSSLVLVSSMVNINRYNLQKQGMHSRLRGLAILELCLPHLSQ